MNSLTLILDWFEDLGIDSLAKIVYPNIVLVFINDSRVDEFSRYEEVLMDIVNQVL